MKSFKKLIVRIICIVIVVAVVATMIIPSIFRHYENSTSGTSVESVIVPTKPENLSKSTPSPKIREHFIAIDPIGAKTTGDLVIITGTTSLPSGASVYLKEINEHNGESTMRANTIVCPDSNRINRFSFAIDSTDRMRPGCYYYIVSTPKGDLNESVQFNLDGIFRGPENTWYYQSGSKDSTIKGTGSFPYIMIDSIGDRKTGDIFRISGTTNLREGAVLDCTVWPVYFEDRSKRPAVPSDDPCAGQYNMVGYTVVVVKGTTETNRWSFPADMRIFPPDTEMIVHVSTTNEDLTRKEIFGNATFLLN